MQTLSHNLFFTVPSQDFLSLYQDNSPKYQGVVQFLEFKKEDVSKASGVPLSSVRYDEKMPAELQERIREWATLLNLVAEHFHGDAGKTALWFTTLNPLLGNIAPRDMIRFGKYKKLLKFVMNAISNSKR